MKAGRCRFVFFVGRYAVKIPRLDSYEGFLQGLISNLNERRYRKPPNKHLCPIAYANCLGLLVVMRKAQAVIDIAQFNRDLDAICDDEEGLGESFYQWDGTPKNFGYLDGHLVKIDYGD
nr:MAG TPA: hypothetical protein [Caudoviricetes sp.]